MHPWFKLRLQLASNTKEDIIKSDISKLWCLLASLQVCLGQKSSIWLQHLRMKVLFVMFSIVQKLPLMASVPIKQALQKMFSTMKFIFQNMVKCPSFCSKTYQINPLSVEVLRIQQWFLQILSHCWSFQTWSKLQSIVSHHRICRFGTIQLHKWNNIVALSINCGHHFKFKETYLDKFWNK